MIGGKDGGGGAGDRPIQGQLDDVYHRPADRPACRLPENSLAWSILTVHLLLLLYGAPHHCLYENAPTVQGIAGHA